MIFTPGEREALRSELIEAARKDPRITGGAMTGSVSVGKEDRWSDIDLAFGVGDAAEVKTVLAEFSERIVTQHGAVDTLDVVSGSWIYRVFLLPSTLQVDLAFATAADFGGRGTTFRLLFGEAQPAVVPPASDARAMIGLAWLYALHVRAAVARGKVWQAEYMIGAMRNQVLALACVRYGLNPREARGTDALPVEVTEALKEGLVRALEGGELRRAFGVVTQALLREIERVDPELEARLAPTLWELNASAGSH